MQGDECGVIRQIVLQPTPFCNINCSYCYLPDRTSNEIMTLETVARTFERVLEYGRYHSAIDLRWHAGEPMVVSPDFYRDAIETIQKILPDNISLKHSMQTNGTLLNDRWCRFIIEHDIRVGLSIDGPDYIHDKHRRTRLNEPTHQKVMAAVKLLKKHQISFEVIVVVTPDTLGYANELYRFLSDINPVSVGLNIEETEGVHESELVNCSNVTEKYEVFFSELYELQRDGRVKFREVEEMTGAILYGDGDRENSMVKPFDIVSVDCNGNYSTFSPELLGARHELYDDFKLGNVYEHSFESIMDTERFKMLLTEISEGSRNCQNTCQYYSVCGGGSPSNKLFENGSLASTETQYCISRIKIPAERVLSGLEEDRALCESEHM